LLAALSRSLPRIAWAGFPVKPETLLRWHRQLVARRWTCAHRAPGRPPLESSVRELILRLAEENGHWGYKRIVGELKGLGIVVSATSVRKVLLEEGLQPAPQRSRSSWRAFLRAHAASILACDFLTVETAFLQRIYVLFFISLATRRIEYIASTSNPDGCWIAQQARNLVMQLGDQHRLRFLIHDRDTKFSHAFDEVFRTEGIKVIRTPIQAPNANAYAERWVRTVRSDCLDRVLIFDRRHLEYVLRVYRRHYNEHRPHRVLDLTPVGFVNSVVSDLQGILLAPRANHRGVLSVRARRFENDDPAIAAIRMPVAGRRPHREGSAYSSRLRGGCRRTA
jgi:transposase InsO family protein